MTLNAGSRLGPYEIVSLLGAGGMGEVYKARDTRLDRDVAVKVLLTGETTSDEMRQRFEREAKAISQLSHPHICALYDVGSHEGTEYLVMEYLEGETLATRHREGPAAARPAPPDRDPDRRRARPRAPARDRPPRPQARQRHAHEERREAARLRSREDARPAGGPVGA